MGSFIKTLTRVMNGLMANDGTGDSLRAGANDINSSWTAIESAVNALAASQGSGVRPYATVAAMNADAQPDGVVAVVYADPTPANNTSYARQGGAWITAYDRLTYALGNGSGFQQAGTGSILRSIQDELRYFVKPEQYGAVGDGSTDDTAAFVAALATGKSILLDEKIYVIGPITLGATQKIRGKGIWKTQLKAKSNCPSGFLVSLANANVYAAGVHGLTVNCNKSAQTNTVSGIGFDNTGGTGFPFGDPKHSIAECYVVNSNGTGYLIGNVCRGSTLRELYANQCDVYGIEISCTDSHISDVVAGACGTGIYSHGTNNRHLGLKAFGGTVKGIRVEGQRDTWIDCESQDNAGDGYVLASGDRDLTLIGCLADSNQSSGFNLQSAVGAKLVGVRSMTRTGGAYTQASAFNFGASTRCYVQGKATGNTAVYAGTVTNNTTLVDDGTGQDFRSDSNVIAQQAESTEVLIGALSGAASVRLGGDITFKRESASVVALSGGLRIQGFSILRSGTGVPSNSIDNNGDLYIRQDGAAGSFLYAKVGGAWFAIA